MKSKIKESALLENLSKSDVVYRHSLIFLFALVLIIGSSIVLWYTHSKTSEMNRQVAELDANHLATTVSKFRDFYSQEIVGTAKDHGMSLSHDYKDKPGVLPLPATFAKDFAETLSSSSDYTVRLYSDLPFPWRDQDNDELDQYEVKTLKQIKNNPAKPVVSFDTINGVDVVRYARGDIMKESCVACHNSYPGTPKADWKVGDVRGVLEVVRPVLSAEFNTIAVLKDSFLMMLAIILTMVGLVFFVLRKLTASHDSTYEAYINEEKTARELKTSDAKMRAIVNSVQEVIIVINEKGIITECNYAIKQVFGYTQEEILGQNVSILMPSDHHKHHDQYIQAFMKNNEGSVMGNNREFSAIRKNGEVFPIELFVNDARVGDDIIFTGSIRDITHRKKSEEITAKAHQSALESAQLKSEFLANMSHEIRTPMNGVIGMTELLLLSKLDEEQKGLANTVKESAGSLLTIINDILDFSKIEAGKLSIKQHKVNLLNTIEGAIDLLAKEANRKQVELAYFIDKSVPLEITSDAGRLRQIMINLFNNALKFTEEGHVLLYVTMKDKETMHFSVVDTGTGIPKDALATLFDSFSQVDGSSSREHGGTGLGLAICKQLVTLMGGKMGVTSQVGVGSTFTFTIKVDAIEAETKPFIQANSNVLMWSTSESLNRYYKHQLEQWSMNPNIVTNLNHLNKALIRNNNYHMLALDADNIFIDPENPNSFSPVLDSLRSKTDAVFILYAGNQQYKELEKLSLDENTILFRKPIKHTAIKALLEKLNKRATSELHKEKGIVRSIDSTASINQAKEEVTEIKRESFHVLLAEDNLVNQKVAVMMLSKLGCEATVANNGKEAFELVENQQFDAVFMDCQMPDVDGYESTRMIRKLDTSHHSQDIPVIAFTANAMKDDDKLCKDAGMDDYLSKPVNLEELEKVLGRWVDQMRERKAARLNQSTKSTDSNEINNNNKKPELV